MINQIPKNWQKVKLGDICLQITDGKHGDCLNQNDSGYYFISSKDVFGGYIHYENARQITEADFFDTHRRTKLEIGDVLITNSGTIGRMALIKNDARVEKTTFQKSVAIIKPKRDSVHNAYLYYKLLSLYKQLVNLGGGSAQHNLLLGDLRKFSIQIPDIETQTRIASILSAYDDLIENNNKQIKTLEEMAQAIFKEWFVKFKFPDHKKVKIVDSPLGKIPESWKLKNLGNILEELESGSRPKGGIQSDQIGIASIGAENILGLGEYNYSKDKFVSSDFYKSMRKGKIKSRDVLLYKDGAQIGRKSMFRDNFPYEECCINEHVFILRANQFCTQNYLYFWLDQSFMTEKIKNLNANAAQPGINQQGVRSLPILIPDKPTVGLFEEIIDPIIALLFNLAKENNSLSKTRDLLLPKLMKGEIGV